MSLPEVERKEMSGFVKGRFWRMCPRFFSVPSFCFLYPRSGFLCRRFSFFVPSFRGFGVQEHPPKPPFWKPPFANPRRKVVHHPFEIPLFRLEGLCSDKTKGQQLQGKIVSALFHAFGTFPDIYTLFQSFSEFASRTFLRSKGFYYCFSSKRRQENKRE